MRCRNCGWDNPNQNTVCEKCGAPLSGASNVNPNPVQEPIIVPPTKGTVNETLRENPPISQPNPQPTPQPAPTPEPTPNPTPNPGTTGFGGTVPPWMQMTQVGYCRLTPMENFPGERHMPQEAQLKGEYIEINRGNLDPDNNTISQKVQAIITYENGQWFIKDESAYKTTYIYAGEKTPIKSGDVILMGSRRFIFTEE
ncbi:MAG: zinc-ribbon domain-containing protein [Paludibacteraceae bacterium]|nr:zinc-ribbon domain-containing protein [Paludibacteraceae bacterium]